MTGLEIMILGIACLGCGLAGYSAWTTRGNARRLSAIFESGTIEDADALIEAYAERFNVIDQKLQESFTRLSEHDKMLSHAIQKVGIKRFNPFDDMGGETSFVLALLDQENTGVLITSITMRDGTRVYTKRVEGGTCQVSLSDEESSLLQQTTNQHS